MPVSEIEELRRKVKINEEILFACTKVLDNFGKRLTNIEFFLADKRFLYAHPNN